MPKIKKNNLKVRKAIMERNLTNYEVARLLGYREDSFSRLLRYELPNEVQEELVKQINELRPLDVENSIEELRPLETKKKSIEERILELEKQVEKLSKQGEMICQMN